jgi:hypothetical protein
MTTEVPEQSYNLSESKEAQSIPYFTRLIRVDRVGVEPTTSAMPTNFHLEISMKKESIMFESHPFHYLSDFYDLA